MSKLTPAQKSSLTHAHETGCGRYNDHPAHTKMLNRLVDAGLLTKKFAITAAGRRAIGVQAKGAVKLVAAVAIRKAPPAWKLRRIELEGMAPLAYANVPSYPLHYVH